MSSRPVALALALVVIGMFACGGILGARGTPTKAPGAFDLADGARDPNGFLLDPKWNTDERVPDPRGCSWRFLDGGDRAGDDRKPCNTRPVDPDFSNTALTAFGLTCLDSDINMRGHINWGEHWGGAVTFEGNVAWDSYSGGSPNDGDYNFVLTPKEGSTLTPGSRGTIKLEFDSSEVNGFASPWWVDFERLVYDRPRDVAGFVGNELSVVTGLLGIDAEHDNHLELHPVYALALRRPDRPGGTAKCKDRESRRATWALFARTEGNQGGCSRVRRVHTISLPDDRYIFWLPLPGATCVEIDDAASRFFGQGTVELATSEAGADSGVLLVVGLKPGQTVDGELHVLTDVVQAAQPPPPPPQASPEWDEFKNKMDELKKKAPEEHRALVESAGGKPTQPIKPVVSKKIPDAIQKQLSPARPAPPPVKSGTKAVTRVQESPEARFCKTPRQSGPARSICEASVKR